MAEALVMTHSLALRIGKSEADHFESWLEVMQGQEGNPFGIEIRRFGRAVAFVNEGMSLGSLFNRVLGFGDVEAEFLGEVVQFYAERGLACRIDVNPYDAGPALFDLLAGAGLHPFRFHNHLYGVPPAPATEEAAGPVTARVIRPEELPTWAEVWLQGYAEALGTSAAMAERLAAATLRLWGQPGWDLYLAFADGQAAAAGGLYVQDRVASLLVSATLPAFRRRGCQKALLQARIADAAGQGCDLIVA